MGAAQPKALVRVGGRRILEHAVCGALAVRFVRQVVVVAPAAYVAELSADVPGWEGSPAPSPRPLHPAGVPDPPAPALGEPGGRVRVVPGGAERTDSVRAGLAALGPDIDIVLIHDAARCLTPTSVYDRVIAAVAAGHEAVVPGLAVVDTMKVVDAEGTVIATPERSRVRAIQTPQGFSRAAITSAHASGLAATDDAGLAEENGRPVRVVDGDPLAFKVTTPDDLERAERLLRTPTLWVIGGLPGTGKTTLSRRLAAFEDATLVRVDSIEQALTTDRDLEHPGTTGYAIAYAVAADQLRLGRSVVADLVNPLPQTRVALRQIAEQAGAGICEIRLVCSDATEHRRRIEGRLADIPGYVLPTWRDVTERLFVAWPEARVIDTAGRTPEQVFRVLRDGP